MPTRNYVEDSLWKNAYDRDRVWRDLPWHLLRKTALELRKSWFSKDRPRHAYYLVDATPAEVSYRLLKHYFRPGWSLSYHYRGEQLNAARATLAPPKHEEMVFQTHIRGYVHGGMVELMAHYEPCPLSHPKAHLHGTGFDAEEGMALLRAVLQAENLTHERLDPGDDRYRTA